MNTDRTILFVHIRLWGREIRVLASPAAIIITRNSPAAVRVFPEAAVPAQAHT